MRNRKSLISSEPSVSVVMGIARYMLQMLSSSECGSTCIIVQ